MNAENAVSDELTINMTALNNELAEINRTTAIPVNKSKLVTLINNLIDVEREMDAPYVIYHDADANYDMYIKIHTKYGDDIAGFLFTLVQFINSLSTDEYNLTGAELEYMYTVYGNTYSSVIKYVEDIRETETTYEDQYFDFPVTEYTPCRGDENKVSIKMYRHLFSIFNLQDILEYVNEMVV